MPSASMYASPYTYREKPPKIEYPGLCSCWNDLTVKFILDSKILALSALIMVIAWFVLIIMTIMPFWFELVLSSKDATFGNMAEIQGLTINTGLFFMREDHFDNLVFLSKYSNRDVVPKILAFAQLCTVLGNTIITCCMLATIILMFRRFGSATGTVMLAAGTTLGAVFEVLSCLFCVILLSQSSCAPGDSGCNYEDNLPWRMIPMYTQFYRVEPYLTPMVKPGFALYINAIGAILCLVGAVFLWIETFNTSKNVSRIRYSQLKEVRDPHEDDINPLNGRKYVYAAPQHYGHGAFGMQPVMYAGQPYPQQAGPFIQPGPQQAGPFIQPSAPSVGFGPAPVSYEPEYKPNYSRDDDSRTESMSESSYYSNSRYGGGGGGGQKREINL